MEYQGIVTGIGDKESKINLIQPEVDAIITKFIIGNNTIIDGLNLDGNVLSKGICVLCGYRGVLNETQTIPTTTKYIYGKFVINFDENIEDTFSIVAKDEEIIGNINPSEIVVAGEYYLELYANRELSKNMPTYKYPAQANQSVITNRVASNGELENGVTCITQLKNDNSDNVANTLYVHRQIEEEIDREEVSGDFSTTSDFVLGSYTLIRKSKLVVGNITVSENGINNAFALMGMKIAEFPDGFIPAETLSFCFGIENASDNGSPFLLVITCDDEGKCVITSVYVADEMPTNSSFGYEV